MTFEFKHESPAGDGRVRMTVADGDVSYVILFIGDEIGNIVKHSVTDCYSPFGSMKVQGTMPIQRIVKGTKRLRDFALDMHLKMKV